MTALTTLELQDVVVRRAGAALTAPLSLSSSAKQVALVGDWSGLIEVLTGRARIAGGSVRVLGHALEFALAEGVLGLGLCDPPLPGSFTVTEYLEYAARLSHGSASRAARDARHTLQRFGLRELASRKLAQIALYQRRALAVALASVASPEVVWLDSPVRGLDAAGADYVARLCIEARTSSRLILSMAFPSGTSAERSLLETCEDVFLMERGVLIAHGSPAQVFKASGRYLLSLSGQNAAAYESALREAGCVVTPRAQSGDYVVELPANGNTDLLLDTALDQQMIVLELEPIHAST